MTCHDNCDQQFDGVFWRQKLHQIVGHNSQLESILSKRSKFAEIMKIKIIKKFVYTWYGSRIYIPLLKFITLKMTQMTCHENCDQQFDGVFLAPKIPSNWRISCQNEIILWSCDHASRSVSNRKVH